MRNKILIMISCLLVACSFDSGGKTSDVPRTQIISETVQDSDATTPKSRSRKSDTVSLEIVPFLKYFEQEGDNISQFRDYLASLYLRYANLKMANKDYSRADAYMSKASQVLAAQHIVNANFENLAIPLENKVELRYAKKRLTFLGENNLISDLFERYKFIIADTVFYFDCWVDQETVVVKYDNSAEYSSGYNCKNLFFLNLDFLEDKIGQARLRMLEEKMDQELKANMNKTKLFVIYFDFDKSNLNEEALRTLIDILNYLKAMRGDFDITLIGHADRAGKVLYNDVLANRRAERVRNALAKNGIPWNSMHTFIQGQNNPFILTLRGVKHKSNRRVEIYINRKSILDSDEYE